MFAPRTWIVIAVLLVVGFAALSNARVSNGAGHETRHRVRAGETLWSIARRVVPGRDVRPVVDAMVHTLGTSTVVAGETISVPTP